MELKTMLIIVGITSAVCYSSFMGYALYKMVEATKNL